MTTPTFDRHALKRIATRDGEFNLRERNLATFALSLMAERETLRAVAITAERLCRYDGSKAMTAKGHYYDAQKAMEFSDRLHELLAEWRKGQKEGRW